MNKGEIALDIFCGSGSFGRVASEFGYEVISLDIRRRKGVCEPTLKLDLSKVPGTFFSSLAPSVGWFAVPCLIWSNASGGYHLDGHYNPKTSTAVQHLKLFHHTLELIEKCAGLTWVIENPRGKLDKYPFFLKWLEDNGGKIHYCTLSSYGFPTTKPTIIATNCQALKLRDMHPYGRGAKNKVPGTFNNMTTVQRQSTPPSLIRDILKQIT